MAIITADIINHNIKVGKLFAVKIFKIKRSALNVKVGI